MLYRNRVYYSFVHWSLLGQPSGTLRNTVETNRSPFHNNYRRLQTVSFNKQFPEVWKWDFSNVGWFFGKAMKITVNCRISHFIWLQMGADLNVIVSYQIYLQGRFLYHWNWCIWCLLVYMLFQRLLHTDDWEGGWGGGQCCAGNKRISMDFDSTKNSLF